MSAKRRVCLTDRVSRPIDGTRHSLSSFFVLVLKRPALATEARGPPLLTLDVGDFLVDQREFNLITRLLRHDAPDREVLETRSEILSSLSREYEVGISPVRL
jgi:hypothetical protein